MTRLILVVGLLFVVCGLSSGAQTIQAQPYPNRPIQLIDAFNRVQLAISQADM